MRRVLTNRLALVMTAALFAAATLWSSDEQAPAPPGTLRDLAGWEFISNPPAPVTDVCVVRPDGVIAVAGKPTGYLATRARYRDYTLHAEWRWPGAAGNGGALVHIASGPKNGAWPLCFQIQMKNGAAGDVLPMAGASFAEPLSTPPDAKTPLLSHVAPDSERPLGEWNSLDVICREGAIDVTINGVRQNRVSGLSHAEGTVGFQLEGTPFELRDVAIRPLNPLPRGLASHE